MDTPNDRTLVVRPDKAVYRRRQFRSVLLWSLGLGLGLAGLLLLFSTSLPTPVSPMVALAVIPLVLLILVGFSLSALGDAPAWRSAAGEIWSVTANGVDFTNTDEGVQGSLDYREIAEVTLKSGNSLQLRLTDGQAVVMRYLTDPLSIKDAIETRRHNALARP